MEPVPGTVAPTWDDARVAELKRLHAEGHSASAIAQLLGLNSRNVVCGKLHRLGLSKERAPDPRKASPVLPMTAAPRQEPPRAEAPTPPVPPPPSLRLVTIDDLGNAMCRWPVGDPSTSDFRYCGGTALTGRPYCEHHAAMAYEPDKRRTSQGVRR